MASYVLIPGAVAAGTPIDLPSDAPRFQRLTRALNLDVGNYPNAAAVNPVQLAVVSAAPASGQIQLTAPRRIVLGDAATANTVIVLFGEAYGEQLKVA